MPCPTYVIANFDGVVADTAGVFMALYYLEAL